MEKLLRLLVLGAILSLVPIWEQLPKLWAQTAPGAAQKQPKSKQTDQAQAPAPKGATSQDNPAPGDQGADVTTATFGDWQLRCQKPAQSAQRNCEVIQSLIMQGQTAPFAQLAFGKVAADGPLYFTAVVPVNISFPSAVHIAVDEKDNQPAEIPWTRCLPAGCFASIALKDDLLKRWSSQNASGRLIFKAGAGQDLTLPFSFRGLARALDAMSK